MAPRKVITSLTGSLNPALDWVAHFEGEEEKPWFYGYGRSEAEAIEDFKRICGERAEAEHQEAALRSVPMVEPVAEAAQ